MGWRRLGQVYAPQGEAPWLMSHASVPFAEPLDGGLHRIWFSPRDAGNRSHVAWIVTDLARPQTILEHSPRPVLGCGPPGTFDDCGAMMSWLTEGRLYYIGWNTRASVPFHVSVGLAERASGDTWRRTPGPILERSPAEPWFCSNPCVLRLPSGGYRMWYLSGLGWEEIDGRWSASYRIAVADSSCGRLWTPSGVAIELQGDEFALARPSVMQTPGGWQMWFCARTRARPYRLCAAVSSDGVTWSRAPELAGLEPAASGWDSEMIAYPHVFEHAGLRWLLYCGAGFGRSGFGLAVWD